MKNKEDGINGIIYGSRNIVNGKWYIGQTTVGLENRRKQHLKAARNNYGHGAFYSAIRKYGADRFEWVVLESNIKTHDDLNEREKFWIRAKNAFVKCGGYNMNFGGNGTANHPKNFTPWNKGKKNCYSAETLVKIGSGMRGKHVVFTDEWKRRISEGKKKYVFTEEHKRHISEHRKGIRPIKCCKPVLMFNRNGDFVAEFPSLRAAADYIGVKHSQVSDVLRGKHKTAGGGYDRNAGYTFKYKNENPDR